MKAIVTLVLAASLAQGDLTQPLVKGDLIFAEKSGIVAIEAEHFTKQERAQKRAWYLTTKDLTPEVQPDGDPSHIAGASGGAYLEILPDTRRSHDDKLVREENFTEKAGSIAVLSYPVHFETPGTYWIWARVHSTTSEDNGLHFGINGRWPDSARRWQTIIRRKWHWKSAQRTKEVHVGVDGILTLEVPSAGVHTIQVSMREDGIALDRILLANRKDFVPEGLGPVSQVHQGRIPKPFPFVKAKAKGKPAKAQLQQHSPRKKRQGPPLQIPREPDGDGSVVVAGEQRQWHAVSLTFDGPFAHELDRKPNPFTDYQFDVVFTHESGSSRKVPGFFAADGNAAESSAESGTKWRVYFSPPLTGKWSYQASFLAAPHLIKDASQSAMEKKPLHGVTGMLEIGESDKEFPDFRARGRLAYVGNHLLQFQGDKSYFLKAGADAPETLLAYRDFDNTSTLKEKRGPLKSWSPHVKDWNEGDPSWQGGKGKGLIGALNYLAAKECNAFSFLTYNVDGDGSNVWPFVHPREKFHYDCSKLDQWNIVFSHATAKGLYLHFKMQETEMDDNRLGNKAKKGVVRSSLDGGKMGPERKLYCRELIARFGHHLALNWNIGEENTQTTEEQLAMAKYIQQVDAYINHVVIHTYPGQQDKIYGALLGKKPFTGISVQNSSLKQCHSQVVKWVSRSAGKEWPWVVAFDEPGNAQIGMPPDPDYPGMPKDYDGPSIHDCRKYTLWGTFMAGGAGVEYYFGYQLPQNDLLAEDWRSRDQSWDYCRIALSFFRDQKIPVEQMTNRNELIGNLKNDNSKYCLAKEGEVYLVYLPTGGETGLKVAGTGYSVTWFNPRTGEMDEPSRFEYKLKAPDKEDWLAVVRK